MPPAPPPPVPVPAVPATLGAVPAVEGVPAMVPEPALVMPALPPLPALPAAPPPAMGLIVGSSTQAMSTPAPSVLSSTTRDAFLIVMIFQSPGRRRRSQYSASRLSAHSPSRDLVEAGTVHAQPPGSVPELGPVSPLSAPPELAPAFTAPLLPACAGVIVVEPATGV